jgi:hypothetical protein
MDAKVRSFLDQLTPWAATQAALRGVLLVGSQARAAAQPGSDIDLVLLTSDPQSYLGDLAWTSAFGPVTRYTREDWGQLTSLRVWYQDGLEVEFGFTRESWITSPLDPGTRQVLADGYQILFERDSLISRVIECP